MVDQSNKPVVLSAQGITKDFYLPHEKNNSLKTTIVNIFKKRNKDVDIQHALRGVSFDVHDGEFFGILGRNGSGKSTLLKILAEIYQPTQGVVTTHGKLVPFIELGVGFNPELTGRENVFLNGALLGFSASEMNERYDDIVEFAELEEFMDQKLKNYSSGMQVRLAFSVATRAEADILLVDEVLAVGDADFQRKCYDYFKSLKKKGKTVVFVTHDMGAVREYCDRAILIQDGVIAHAGLAEDVADEYLKLFNENSEASEDESYEKDDEQQKRWGTRQVFVETFDVNLTDKTISIDVKLKAGNRDVEGVVFGYNFMNSEDRMIMGGNTLNSQGGMKLNFMANESKRLSFTLPNILGSGTYTMSAVTRLSDGVTICDNWTGVATVKVAKTESYYPIIAPAVMIADGGDE